MAKVDLTTAGHTVIVEADEPLDVLAAKALELWRATRDPKLDRNWAATGFTAERSNGEYVAEMNATV